MSTFVLIYTLTYLLPQITPSNSTMASTTEAVASLSQQAQISPLPFPISIPRHRDSNLLSASRLTPTTCQSRLAASLHDKPLSLSDLPKEPSLSSETVLYLGYGSNLSAETFRGKRNIKPISQINVVVPAIKLTFDLPGIPYTEPCFGNCAYREPSSSPPNSEKSNEYHKDHWSKGLVGVVYEVTLSDFRHIIATEGGGSGYQDVLVDCYTLSSKPQDKVPSTPSGEAFKAHTLFAPISIKHREHAYAQPSPRYLKLITDGAAEHNLPYEYQDFLHQIRTYHVTSNKQRLGLFIFSMVWLPLFAFFFRGVSRIFLKPDGRYPEWFAKLTRAMFTACWASYDNFFRPLFGDGERTIGDTDKNSTDEKAPLVRETIAKYGSGGRLETV